MAEARFRQVMTSEADLRAVLGEPNQRALDKVVTRLDQHCRAFIAKSPFVLIATTDATGHQDVSPKGDPPGFVRVLDDTTLAIPDRLGNRRIDGFRNILANPKVGLIFLIPGKRETLRVSGSALIVRDAELRETMVVNGRAPDFALVLNVERALFHCSKCMIRSGLWQPERWPDISELASLAEVIVAHGQLTDTVAEMTTFIDQDTRERLY
jgi:PPOX class probable FMN-dependent enzyme